MRFRSEKGVALITALIVLLLVSAIVVGMSWMVMSDQRLGGNNQSRETAFYGAEAGMEKLTADLGNTYVTKGAVQSGDITTIEGDYPTIPGIQYQNSTGASTYQIYCGTPMALCTTTPPSSSLTVLPPSPYSGMNALITNLQLQVAAQSEPSGAEVKLQRQIQLLAIPVFQFGVFSQTDLSIFNSPNMTFAGRVHTNGNLWLAPAAGPLFLANKVTASGQVIRTNLENGYPGPGNILSTDGSLYGGYVSIALTPGPALATEPAAATYTNTKWRQLDVDEGSVTGYSVYGNVSATQNTSIANPTPTHSWSNVVTAYNGMLISGAPTLDLTTTALGGITNPIFLIRRAVVGERAANLAEFNQQYFSEASLRILLDDYATPGNIASGCAGSDMMALDGIDTTQNPVDLSLLATSTAPTLDGIAWNTATQAWVPLPASYFVHTGANQYAVYNSPATATPGNPATGDGYWVGTWTGAVLNPAPIITGCLKIEYQDTSGNFHDITQQVLNLGFTGRNINPQTANTQVYSFTAPLTLPDLPATKAAGANGVTFHQSPLIEVSAQGPISSANGNNPVTTTKCTTDPSPNAIIRLARVRDNPSTATAGNNYCGTGLADTNTYDYWPMVLYDTREGMYRPFPSGALTTTPAYDFNPQISAEGVMNYIELDAANLGKWFKNNQSTLAGGVKNNTGFALYFSDRRGEQLDTNATDSTLNTRTGSFGFNDVVNPGDAALGCPNGTFDGGVAGVNGPEDLEGDGVFRTYGKTPTPIPNILPGVIPATLTPNLLATATNAVMQNPNCGAQYLTLWPGATYVHAQEARENPPLFFRRALKVVNGVSLDLGWSCYGASGATPPNPPCGLAIASENPVYVQGDFNAAYNPASPWPATGGVATSISADAVTLLSDNWNDVNSFISPYDSGFRIAKQTSYRTGIIAGKQIPFTWPGAASPDDFGTDGGVQNFPRLLENWGGQSLNYMGSFVSFYFTRQAVGLYGYSNTSITGGSGPVLYNPPTRNWNFDTNFSDGPQWLPPDTPVLRTINTTGFSQMLMPTQ